MCRRCTPSWWGPEPTPRGSAAFTTFALAAIAKEEHCPRFLPAGSSPCGLDAAPASQSVPCFFSIPTARPLVMLGVVFHALWLIRSASTRSLMKFVQRVTRELSRTLRIQPPQTGRTCRPGASGVSSGGQSARPSVHLAYKPYAMNRLKHTLIVPSLSTSISLRGARQ